MHDCDLSTVHLQNGELLNHKEKNEDSCYNSVWTRFTVKLVQEGVKQLHNRPYVGHTLPKDLQVTGNISCYLEGEWGGLKIFTR